VTFYERFRGEVARYADGVHRLGSPARAEAVAGLPDELASFLRSFDGADLFIDAVTLYAAADLRRDGELLVFGATQDGDTLALDLARDPPPVLRLEVDTGETLEEGTSFARWIEGFVAAEAIVYDREGEFREGIFGDEGEALDPRAVIRRERKALKVDPEAPAPSWRLARALERTGKAAEAERILVDVVVRSPRFAWAWFDLGRVRRAAGRLAEAEEAFAFAAEAQPDYEPAGYFAAQAARAAAERGDERARAAHAARALELDPGVARAQKAAAQSLLDEGKTGDAREAAATAAAVAPRDLETLDLLKRARG
jgi:tetratricopeptide (TPR) repeat protein